ncbi:MAG: hypothetical protein R2713_05055 [Ilumatobacteraceae bacterium]
MPGRDSVTAPPHEGRGARRRHGGGADPEGGHFMQKRVRSGFVLLERWR